MAFDPHARRFLDMLAAAGPSAGGASSVSARRDAFRTLMRFGGSRPAVGRIEDIRLPGTDVSLPARIYRPADAPPGPLPGFVFLHGGGLVAGGLDTHDTLCRILASETGCRVIAVEYRLAPEHKFPSAHEDACASTRWVLDHAADLDIDPARLGIAGDSAGGTLATVVCQMLRQAQAPRLAFQLLLCPITDVLMETDSWRLFETSLLDKATLRGDLERYAPGLDPSDPRISPLRAPDLGGLPPAFIHTAECDPLCDEGKAYADKLTSAGVAVRHTCHAGMVHLFYALGSVIPYARVALTQIGEEIRLLAAT
ncbi:MAG: alpha/beta hydrolase [Methylobacteriaceae bacterium]|nr:alpha/beta hydrolase [Methylobacteriaceae bacterium]MBV9244007.1 alpha/beta hydrolase [Methylobacteriaceae bacterium]